MKKILTASLSILIISIFSPIAANAATAPTPNGYRIFPVRTDLTIQPGATTNVTVYLQNISSANEDVQTVIDDFEPPANESGNPALILNGQEAPSHGLKQFITVKNPVFTITPNQTETVNVQLSIPLKTPSGGYYSAVRFAPAFLQGSKNVNLAASVASLILVTVPGNLNEQLSIRSFGVYQGDSGSPSSIFFNNKNITAFVSFQNNGNVQLQPFGNIELNEGSSRVKTYKINDVAFPGNVLPASAREFTVSLTKLSWFGKYKIVGSFGYGSKGQLLTASSTFYIIPVLAIVIVIALIILVIALIFIIPKAIRRYNRRVIARANKNRH